MMNDKVIDGPVHSAATVPVIENRPAPIMTPTPNATRLIGPKTRFKEEDPDSLASACSDSMLYRINNPMNLAGLFFSKLQR